MILEGMVTTTNADGSTNISPMGPIVDASMNRLTLRPFQTSTTYQNLKRDPFGVLHVTDDVLLIARGAIGRIDPQPPLIKTTSGNCMAMADACRWYAFEVESIDDADQRTTIECRVTEKKFQREFFGFNRAKHAVLEAAILATRVGILPDQEILAQLEPLEIIVDKTSGEQERSAFDMLRSYIGQRISPQAT